MLNKCRNKVISLLLILSMLLVAVSVFVVTKNVTAADIWCFDCLGADGCEGAGNYYGTYTDCEDNCYWNGSSWVCTWCELSGEPCGI